MTESKQPSEQPYTEPVSQLLELGDPRPDREWRDYRALGLTEQDVPELIRLMLDDELLESAEEEEDDEETSTFWAHIHAWRALAQLEAESAVPALVQLLPWVDEFDDDWVGEELPVVFAHIGRPALEPLRDFLADTSQGMWARSTAGTGIAEIAKRNPELRAESLAILSGQLANFEQQDPDFNALVVGALVDMKGVEAAPLIEQAFAAKKVDLMLQGDWEDVQVYLGLLDKRQTERPDYRGLMAATMGIKPLTPGSSRAKAREEAEERAREQRKAERKAKDKAKAKARAKQKQARKQRKRK